MEKFSYGLEFYKNKIYKLEDTDLFKIKIKEAEKIEKVLFNTLSNIELVRKYVLRSYYFDKKITFEDRIDFIKGLILADNVISYKDAFEFCEEIQDQMKVYKYDTVWKRNGYFMDSSKIYLPSEEADYIDISEIYSVDEIDSSIFDKVPELKSVYDMGWIGCDSCIGISGEGKTDEVNSSGFFQKLNKFIENKDYIINEIINHKNIPKDRQKMVRKGMDKWLDYVLSIMKDSYDIRVATLTYKAKNASDYL